MLSNKDSVNKSMELTLFLVNENMQYIAFFMLAACQGYLVVYQGVLKSVC